MIFIVRGLRSSGDLSLLRVRSVLLRLGMVLGSRLVGFVIRILVGVGRVGIQVRNIFGGRFVKDKIVQ